MTYEVILTPLATEQLAALPHAAQVAFEELRKRIAEDPWDFQPAGNPTGNMRQAAFGGYGLAVFVILDRQVRVDVVRALWAGDA